MNREKLDSWCEWGILGLVLSILVLGPLALGGVPTLSFLIIQCLTLLAAVLWGIRLWVSPKPQLLWPPVCWAVLAFTGYAVFRYFTADIEYVARGDLLRVVTYAFLFLLIVNNLHRQQSTSVISFTMIFLAMAIAFYAAVQYLMNSDHVWWFIKPYPHRGSGTYICPNHLGGFLEMLLPLGLAYTLVGRVKPVTRIFIGYATAVIAAGIVVTISRGSWVAASLAVLVLFGVLLFHRDYRLQAAVLLGVLLLAGAFFAPKVLSAMEGRLRAVTTPKGEVDDSQRFSYWEPAVRVWQESPWTGVGPGHFEYHFRAYRPIGVQLNPDRVHNDYLNALADWGLAGTALVAAAWGLVAFGLRSTWRAVRGSDNSLGRVKGSNRFAFVLGASLGLLAILAHSFVDFNMQIPANAILAVALLAMVSGHIRFATERFWFRAGIASRALVSVGVLLGGGYLGWQAWRGGQEYSCLRGAEQAPLYSAEQEQFLTQAFTVEPKNPETACSIGECLRLRSTAGGDNSEQLAKQAMDWFSRSITLNPYNVPAHLGYGACLDWLGKYQEATRHYERAEQLDPNSYFVAANVGRHLVNMGDYAAAKPWLERSIRLAWKDNDIASTYLQIANTRLLETATNEFTARLVLPSQH